MDEAWQFAGAYFALITGDTDEDEYCPESLDEIHEGDLVSCSLEDNVMRFVDATGFTVKVTVEIEEN
jgi:hypothetical protein